MSMIPARRGLSAFFRQENGRLTEKEVLAFDEDGYALVLGEKGLERAARYSNFDRVGDAIDSASYEYESLIPGGGWMARYFWKDQASGETKKADSCVVAWALTPTGEVKPLVWDVDMAGLDDVPSNATLWHPDDSDGAPEEAPA